MIFSRKVYETIRKRGIAMKHAYYLSKDLDELEAVHDELVESGIEDSHIHVLSDAEAGVEQHHMRRLNSFSKTDVVRSTMIGAVIGAVLAFLIMSVPFLFDLSTAAGNMPFVFAAIILLGFAAWEGGFLGIQKTNHKFASVDKEIHDGQHLMIVDFKGGVESAVNKVISSHPQLRSMPL